MSETFVDLETAKDILAETRMFYINTLRAPHAIPSASYLRGVNILLTQLVGSGYRIEVIRELLGLDEKFTSTKQLTYVDCRVLRELAYGSEFPGGEISDLAKHAFEQAKRKVEEAQYEALILPGEQAPDDVEAKAVVLAA